MEVEATEQEKLISVGGRESAINVYQVNTAKPITYTAQTPPPIRKVSTPIEVPPPRRRRRLPATTAGELIATLSGCSLHNNHAGRVSAVRRRSAGSSSTSPRRWATRRPWSTHDGMVKMPGKEHDTTHDRTRTTAHTILQIVTEWRNNERVLWRATADVWEPIWKRVVPHVPNAISMCGTYWTPYGLNERLRFYRCTYYRPYVCHVRVRVQCVRVQCGIKWRRTRACR